MDFWSVNPSTVEHHLQFYIACRKKNISPHRIVNLSGLQTGQNMNLGPRQTKLYARIAFCMYLQGEWWFARVNLALRQRFWSTTILCASVQQRIIGSY